MDSILLVLTPLLPLLWAILPLVMGLKKTQTCPVAGDCLDSGVTVCPGMLWTGTALSVGLMVWSALMGLQSGAVFQAPWIKELGIHWAFSSGGLASALLLLAAVIFPVVVQHALNTVRHRQPLFFSLLFLLMSGVSGTLLAADAFVFFLMFELQLVPMALMIALWGKGSHGSEAEQQAEAKKQGFTYGMITILGSVFVLGALLSLASMIQPTLAEPEKLFLFETLRQAVANGHVPPEAQIGLALAFLIGFGLKFPMVPLHRWLPSVYAVAPTSVNMLSSGLMVKLAAVGLIRFAVDLFPQAVLVLAPLMALLGVASILYGAVVTLAQRDVKQFLAYSSISHMGFVLLALAAGNGVGMMAATLTLVAHGLSSVGLFVCVSLLEKAYPNATLDNLRGVGQQLPVVFYAFMFFTLASLGLPLLPNFAGELATFWATSTSLSFQSIQLGSLYIPVSINVLGWLTAVAVVLSAGYGLWLLKRLFFDAPNTTLTPSTAGAFTLQRSDVAMLVVMILASLIVGFLPNTLTQLSQSDVVPMGIKIEQIVYSLMKQPHQ